MTQASSPPTACPSAAELSRYANGWMDEVEFEHADTHISDCPACAEALSALEDAPDSLTQAIRECSSGSELKGHIDEVAAALDTAKGFMDDTAPSVFVKQPVESVGAYDLLEPLGHGGMGVVYLAKHRELQKQVAIKLLPASGVRNEEARARFSREVLAVGSLNDPRIVAATDAGETDGMRFLVMEHVSGLDLSQLVRHVGKLTIADACAIAREIALGLSTAHAEGVVHRDVKPSNVMLDGSGRVKILDFGLAQLGEQDGASLELTTVGQLLGTLDYMAPEQADRGGVVDYRADLYSLGATLFRLLAGRAPLAAAPNQSPLQKLRLLANHSAPSLSGLREDAPAELVELVGQLLDRHPENRPASAAHVAEQLLPYTSDAELPALIARGQRFRATTPDPDRTVHSMLVPVASDESGGSSGIGKWLGRAAAALLAMAGLFLLIDTQKGRIVIESDVADVQVRIVKDGEEVDSLKVRQGAESTKLWAGRYEVVIDAPSEDMIVENDSFVLKRGAVVVARISTKDTSGQQPSANKSAEVDPNAPTYRDKTLDQWLAILRRERDLKSVLDCFDAIKRLHESRKAEEITAAVLIALKSFEKSTYYQVPSADRNSVGRPIHLDHSGFNVLRVANPGTAYYELLLKEMQPAEGEWFNRLMARIDASAEDDWSSVRTWLIRLITDASMSANQKKIDVAADYLRGFTAADDHYGKAVVAEVTNALIRSSRLTEAWWMGIGPRGRHRSAHHLIRQEANRRALRILADSEAEPRLLVNATLLLASDSQISASQRVQIAQSIGPQLRRAVAARDRFALVGASAAYHNHFPPMLESQHRVSNSGHAGACLLAELLDLAYRSELQGKLDTTMKAVCDAIGDGPPLAEDGTRLYLDWPEMDYTVQTSRGGGRGRGGLAAAMGGMGSRPTRMGREVPTDPIEIRKRVLRMHPMVQDYRSRMEPKNILPDPAANPLSTPESSNQQKKGDGR